MRFRGPDSDYEKLLYLIIAFFTSLLFQTISYSEETSFQAISLTQKNRPHIQASISPAHITRSEEHLNVTTIPKEQTKKTNQKSTQNSIQIKRIREKKHQAVEYTPL
jgi:hypothetical protein